MALGEFAALGDAVCWAATGVSSRRIGRGVRPVHLSAALAASATVALTVLAVAVGEADDVLRTPAWSLALFAGGAVMGALGMLAFFMAAATGSVGATYTTTSGLYILFSMIAGVLLLDDEAGPITFVGAAAIVGGLYLLNSRPAVADAGAAAAVEGGGQVVREAPATARRLFPPQALRRLNPVRRATGGASLRWLVLATLTAALWSVDLIASARGLERADLLANAFMHQAVPALMFCAFVAVRWRSAPAKFASGDRWKLTLTAVFYLFSGLAWNYALDNADAGVTALLASTSPVFAMLLAAVILRERLSPTALAGAGVAFAGIIMVVAAK